MTMVKFSNNGELLREALVPRNFTTLVDNLFNEALRPARAEHRPLADIIENENAYEIHSVLPGFKKENIHLEVRNHTLYISGERKEVIEKEQYHLKESFYGTFQRQFHLPENINKDSIKAEFKDGILIISLEKIQDSTTKIEIA